MAGVRSDFIKTDRSDYVSRKARAFGAANVRMTGKVRARCDASVGPLTCPLLAQCVLHHDVTLRGDLAKINIGFACFLDRACELRPGGTADE